MKENSVSDNFRRLYEIIVTLRGPGGCPWDREQTPLSLREDLVEETYECIEAIAEGNPAHVKEELGDLFLLVLLLSLIYEQEGSFTAAEVLSGASEKLIRRHPHVFGDVEVKDSKEALNNWAKIKVVMEGRKPKDSILDEVKAGLPPLERAYKLQKIAAGAGYDWPDLSGVLAKADEELEEVRDAVNSRPEHLEEELGDFLFMGVNLCRFLNIEPSAALSAANTKFIRRFGYIEKKMKETGAEMKQENLRLMDEFWEEAKKQPC